MLEVESLKVCYQDAPALTDVSLNVAPGEIVAVLGANSAGKSTLLWAISRGIGIHGGDIRYEGKSLLPLDASSVVRRGIMHCPEGRRLFASLTVGENVRLGLISTRSSRGERNEVLQFVREIFPIVFERWHQRAGTLSGGEQQMVAVARSIVARPSLLLLDEPSLGLAPRVVQLLYAALRRLQLERGTAILLVEQNFAVALSVASRAYLLCRGRLVFSANAGGMFAYLQDGSRHLIDESAADLRKQEQHGEPR